MTTKLQELNQYIARHLKSGGGVQTYLCPACENPITTPSPDDPADMWDSIATCPHCDALHLREVYYDSAMGTMPN